MTNRQLIEQLKHEAGGSGPAFSDDLHRKIMDRIDTEPAGGSARTSSRSFWRFAAVLSAAAAVAVAIGLVRYFRPAVKPAVEHSVALRIPAAPVISNPVRSLEGPAVRQWAGSQVADVDKDAGNVVLYVQRQFDVIPSPR